ncbi:MAG: hypothetical protein EOR11_20215 [Mesorhizobium sp.]|uniref:hypothetical protein n=1 Tax=Mesorhizobium sp. TaxID=1871066 RepID=UPI000FE79020|nr:hypothetical protein [Mesorhizobium sp.]RWP84632.1 MAG: hypothetical protein EOR11_20215 [Mesorhizobium sp.]
MTDVTLDIFSVAEAGGIGGVRVGEHLNEIAELVGPPDYWGFGPDEIFNGYMGFGPIEIYVRSRFDMPFVSMIKIDLMVRKTFFRLKSKSQSDRYAVTLPKIEKRTFDDTLNEVRRRKIPFSTEFGEEMGPDTSRVIDFLNGSRFYFANFENPILFSLEILDP